MHNNFLTTLVLKMGEIYLLFGLWLIQNFISCLLSTLIQHQFIMLCDKMGLELPIGPVVEAQNAGEP